MKNIESVINEAEAIFSQLVEEKDYRTKEVKNENSVIIEIVGYEFNLFLDSHKEEAKPLPLPREIVKLQLSEHQRKAVYTQVKEEIELAKYQQLKEKYGDR